MQDCEAPDGPTTPGSVSCPICECAVAERDINLHLDLQCRGPSGPSRPARRAAVPGESSADAGPSSSPLVEQTSSAERSAGPRSVAPVFAGIKRRTSGLKVEDERAGGKSDAESKRARVNPLMANQP